MKKETRTALKDHLDDELKALLDKDPAKLEEQLNKRTDDEWLAEAETQHKSPLIPLFRAMKKAEENPSQTAERDVWDTAFAADDYAGIFLRKALKRSDRMISASEYLELYYISRMSSYQIQNKQSEQSHRVALSPSTLLKNEAAVTGPLLDPAYKAAYIKHRVELTEATQETFDKAEPSLAPLAKRAEKRGGTGAILAFLVWIIGGLFIWNTFGGVWNWAFEFIDAVFFPLILFFWVIPILYALIVAGLFLWLGTVVSDFFTKGANKKLDAKLTELKSDAAYSVRNTEAAKIVDQFDKKLPHDFRNYAGHMALAAVAALTGETSMTDLGHQADDESTWFTRLHKKYVTDEKLYDGAIGALLREDHPTDTDVFCAYTLLNKRRVAASGFSTETFLHRFMTSEKENKAIRGKLLACFTNFFLDTLRDAQKENTKYPGMAKLLKDLHEDNYAFNVDDKTYLRFHTNMRSAKSLIDWHLGIK